MSGSIYYRCSRDMEHPVNIGCSKKNMGHRKLTEDFNQGLQEIKANGTYHRILEENALHSME